MGVTKNLSTIKDSLQEIFGKSRDDDFNVVAFENLDYNPAGDSASASVERRVTGELSLRSAVDSSDSSITYIGEARVGEATSNGVWRVQKITSSSITWADGNANFDNIWDNRESLSYE